MEDALDGCDLRVAAAKKEADKSKAAASMRQSVRQDMRLRAKVGGHHILLVRGGSQSPPLMDPGQPAVVSWRL